MAEIIRYPRQLMHNKYSELQVCTLPLRSWIYTRRRAGAGGGDEEEREKKQENIRYLPRCAKRVV